MSEAPRILVVDDEAQIQRFLRTALTANGYEVLEAVTGARGAQRAAAEAPDIVILDLGLPDCDGKEVIRQIRDFSPVPIIVLSARSREAEKIAALDLGADDYIDKPFAIGELLARLRAALRRRLRQAGTPPVFRLGSLSVDLVRRAVKRGEAAVHLTPKEYELLRVLILQAGKVMTHRQLLQAVWGPAHVEDAAYLRVFIGQLRRKLEDDGIIVTEPGIGYRLRDE